MALNQEFSILWTYSGWFAALNQDFGCFLWSGATKCPQKFSVALYVMFLIDHRLMFSFKECRTTTVTECALEVE